MLSRKQADAASEALLESGRHERDKGSPLLLRFPELASLPYAERKEALKQAQRAVWLSWPMLLVSGVLLFLAGLWISGLVMRLDSAQSMWMWPILVAIFLRQLVQRQVRRELRRKVDPRQNQGQ